MFAELSALLSGKPVPPTSEPWLVWLAICLCRQRAKQTWLCEVSTALTGDGAVPGHPGWQAEHHGKGLCLRGPDGELVDMDFAGDDGRTIDPYFFAGRVMTLKNPTSPEAHLRHWLPHVELVVAGLGELRRRGVIGHPDSTHVFRLSHELEAIHERVAALGAGQDLFEWRPLIESGGDRAAGPRHTAWLLSLLADRQQAARVLEAVARVLPRTVVASALEGLLGEPDTFTATAIDWCAREHVDVSAAVCALLPRLDPAELHPFIASAAGDYLLQRRVERAAALDVVRRFADVVLVKGYLANPMIDRLAAILLEHSPQEALAPLRRALRGTPICAANTAALLMGIDEPWCHRELAAVLDDPSLADDLKRRAALALQASSNELARAKGAGLPAPPPGGSRPGYSWDEVDAVLLETTGLGVDPEIRERALRLRGRPAPT